MTAKPTPNASYSLTLRVRIQNEPGKLGEITTAIGRAGGDIEGIDIVSVGKDFLVRDITVNAASETHDKEILTAVGDIDGVEVVNVSDRTFLMHLGGKIEVVSKVPLKTRADLSMAYTPGVARICEAIAKDPEKRFNLTIKKNTVAVVSDGTAVLGLGDIGPAAAMPVMEGKCQLFKEFGGVDAFPICLNTKDPHEIVQTIKNISVAFGGINLEDISAPRCFEIEERLKEELNIPVFHDDQHGTAVVVLAALINALKITGKRMEDIKLVVNGIGAAGVACSKIVMAAGVTNIIGCDTTGALYAGRKENMNWVKDWYARNTNPDGEQGTVHDIIKGADVFFGLSAPGLLTPDDLDTMAKDPIVFAMANPVPEIMPEDAAGHVAVMATGRSDYPNQINNVLCFPGIFRGALNCRARQINGPMKLAAAEAIAETILPEELHPDYIIPSVFDRRVGEAVAARVEEAAHISGVARRERVNSETDIIEARHIGVTNGIKVGTCGFGRVKRPDYVELFPVVEIQHTFYHPPEIKTLEKWRRDVPDEFEFTLKAWQMITHESSSPTYRRLKRPLTDKEIDEIGFFKPTASVREALKVTLECAKALQARTILFQCPAKFQPLPENILNLKRFFTSFDRTSVNCVWEPRGKLWEDDIVRDICDELGLWHCVDPFARSTVTPLNCYYRMHGIPRWRYTYEDDELYELAMLVPRDRPAYVFFNNITMKDDALRFIRVLGERED